MTQAPKYDMTVYPVQVAVRSQSDGAAVHMVTLPYCDCPDFTNRKGKVVETGDVKTVTLCKHLAEALERVAGWHRPAPTRHEAIPQKKVIEYLADQPGLSDSLIGAIGATLAEAVFGSPTIIPAAGRRGEIRIEVIRERGPRLYTVTIPG
jgi:hypothetical protein